ncbi:MAG: molybdenum cofactor guanylyltransferase [Actinobacteria bacterium]|nr:molybdenum cofactor guanylyltransferase [Actinomycetota bacterium]
MHELSAIILTGGTSERMGADKAFLEIDGTPLVVRVAAALQRAGAVETIAVGGDLERLHALGIDARADNHPGEGPLGGLLTGLAAIGTDIAFVTACDHPALDPRLLRALAEQADRPGALVVVPVADDTRQVLAALFHTGCAEVLAARFAAGERSIRSALDALDPGAVVDVEGLPEGWFVDLDTPTDVRNYALRDGRSRD